MWINDLGHPHRVAFFVVSGVCPLNLPAITSEWTAFCNCSVSAIASHLHQVLQASTRIREKGDGWIVS